ncbi:ATP/GTP-binding protein, partial [Streptomyces sp. SMC 277]|nr:ATP/GTP-binding protein [Streptomyces antimicrobicus]
MDRDGTAGAPGASGYGGAEAGAKVPRPAGPPPMPAHPPRAGADGGGAAGGFAEWLRVARPTAEPGVWRFGFVPRPEPDPEAATPARSVLSSALISFLACVLLWSLIRNGYLEAWDEPLKLFTPDDWWDLHGEPVPGHGGMTAKPLYELLFDAALLYGFGRLGRWRNAWNRLVVARGPWARAGAAGLLALLLLLLVDHYQLPLRQLVYSLLPFGDDGVANKELVDTADLLVDVAVVLGCAVLGGWFRLLTARAKAPAGAPT